MFEEIVLPIKNPNNVLMFDGFDGFVKFNLF